MKKMILSLFVAIVGTLSCFAQDDLVATLNHGANLSTFTGEDALAQAYEAAVDGDIITLSPGVFVAVDMKKAIILRGAGYKPMASNGYVSTQITGSMSIEIPTEGKAVFTMEGLHFLNSVNICSDKKYDVVLSKSRFTSVSGHGVNLKATHCIFVSSLAANATSKYNGVQIYRTTSVNCQSCVIGEARSSGLDGTRLNIVSATNCILGALNNTSYSVFANSIIVGDSYRYGAFPETCSIHNCIGINRAGTANLFSYIKDSSNVMIDDGAGETAYAQIFKTLKDVTNPSLYETFELTDAAKTTYLGDDGTQVGIYGGTSPFTLESTNPQVTKFVVSSTTEGSQLKVKINVE